jgi:hypothetical protein
MPADDRVRLHQCRAPVPPRMGEQHPNQSLSTTERRALVPAFEHGQLVTERRFSSATARWPQQISASDRITTMTAGSMRYPGAAAPLESTGLAGDLILAMDTHPQSVPSRARRQRRW